MKLFENLLSQAHLAEVFCQGPQRLLPSTLQGMENIPSKETRTIDSDGMFQQLNLG